MRTGLILFFFMISHYVFAATLPQKGFYRAVVADHQEVCDQAILPSISDGVLNTIKVYYVGHCGEQGPYSYACEKNVCTDGYIEFNFTKKNQYKWSNLPHDIHATMKYFKKIK